MLKQNKHILFVLVLLCLLLIIPCSFAADLANDTYLSDVNDDASATEGTVIYVNDTTDSISEAVNAFNSSVNSNIYIKNGNYKINSAININKDITIIGESKEGTVLYGDGTDSIFKLSTNSKVTLVNMTFKNAKGNGALYLDAGDTVIVDDCIFTNNSAGAIYYHYAYIGNIVINVTNSIFKDNYLDDDGGAIHINRGSLNVKNSVFENNGVSIANNIINNGGAIYAGGGILNAISLDSCRFINNTATRGSALSVRADCDVYIFNSVFENNTSPGNYGNYNFNVSSCLMDITPSLKGINLYLKNNTIENNVLNNEILTTEKVNVTYLDKNVYIAVDNLDKIYGDDYNFNVKLADLSGNPLSAKEITVVLTNTYNSQVTTISNITNSEGIAVISLNTQKPGKYSVVSTFAGDGTYDGISVKNTITIRTENEFNVVLDSDSIAISEGESYIVTGYIYDEYMVLTNDASGKQYSISWPNNHGTISVVEGGAYRVDGNKFTFDINRCHLVTRDEPYYVTFDISETGSATLKVDLSKNFTNIDKNLTVIYVSLNGSDENGTGAADSPLASLQMALAANTYLGGGKTISVGEGTFEISTFTIADDVTVVGVKSKTLIKQNNGNLGMFEIDGANTVRFVNLSFTGGYATPEPESLIHVTDESTAYIDGCEFYANSAIDGGAIAVSIRSKVYVDNSYFHDNSAITTMGIGGAIYVHDSSYLRVTNSIFVNNTARDGGAIFLGFGSEADIINSTFENNTAIATTLREGGGGAIFTRSNNVNILNSTFKTNYAELYGGAIYLDYGDIEIYKSYFEDNYVKRSSEAKGSAIESSYTSYSNITMHYSVLISQDSSSNYVVNIHNTDENHTADLNYNYWKTKSLKSNVGATYEARIQVDIENTYIYTGDVVEFGVEFVCYDVENGTSALEGYVHDLAFKLIPSIGEISSPDIVVKDNKANFIYEATTVGREVISFENILTHTTYSFDVLNGSGKINLTHSISIDVNKISTITVSFESDVSGNVTIRLNGKDNIVEILDNKAVLEVETAPGDYAVTVVYPGDDIYRGFIDKDSFNVARYESSISAADITVYFNGKFEAVLKDDEGKAISGEELSIKINGTEYLATTDKNGVATLNLNLASVGEYNVVTSFKGNSNYNSSQTTSKITVIYTDIKLNAPDVVINPREGSFAVTVTDLNGNVLNGVDVVIVINGISHNLKTLSDGKVTVDLTDNGLAVGKYDVSVSVPASEVYAANATTSHITVEKILASIKTSDFSAFSSNSVINATLLDNKGNPLSNKTLIFDVNGNQTEVVTDSNGFASLKLNLAPGTYSAVVKLKSDDVFTAIDSNVNVKINPNSVNITADDVVVYYSNGKISVTLTDSEGNPISSKVYVSLNGQTLVITTGADGSGTTPISKLDIGTYEASVEFEGNAIFEAANTTIKITVLSSIQSQDLTRAYLSPYDFTASLVDSSGSPLSNQTVSLVVNGNVYNVTTDVNGVLKLSENLAVGRYAVTVINPNTGEETANYATIVKRITGNANINMYYGAGKSYTVRVFDDNGSVVGAGENVSFTINGKTYTRQTDSNGYASFKITLQAKTYTITVAYKGVKVSNKVVVKPVLTAKNISKKKAKTIKFTAKLVNTNGKALNGKVIKFKFKGKTYTAKTNKKGIATVSLKNLKVGKYTIKSVYGKSTVKNTIKVRK